MSTRHLNRRIKRGTLNYRDNPYVIEYESKYHIGAGLIFRALTLYGDSKYTHNFCEYIANRKIKEPNLSKYTFDTLIEDYENTIL